MSAFPNAQSSAQSATSSSNGAPVATADANPAALYSVAIERALATVAKDTLTFAAWHPDDTTSNGVYPPRNGMGHYPDGSNIGWTTGFVPGMYWLAWEMSNDERFKNAGLAALPSFVQRIDQQQDVDTHDLGFLYTLACVAPWKLLGESEAKRAALAAADYLMTRFLEPAGIVQAWGNLSDPSQRGRTIIDSLMNMPLLYWATSASGDDRYAVAAKRHTVQLRDNIFRADDSTFHTFHWDVESGAPLRGTTAQGHADDSCWARGQAWGILGFALNYRYTRDTSFLSASIRCADYFLAHLPEDIVPYWDLVFGTGSNEERDSSAGAIAVCGLLECAQWLPEGERKQRYLSSADALLLALAESCAPAAGSPSDALLLHGVYSKPEGKGVDEGNLWGDYFYLEALMRRTNPDWTLYW